MGNPGKLLAYRGSQKGAKGTRRKAKADIHVYADAQCECGITGVHGISDEVQGREVNVAG